MSTGGSVRRKSDFNTDLNMILGPDKLEELKKELKKLDSPADRAMPQLKNDLRKKVLDGLKKQKTNLDETNVGDVLKFYAAEKLDETETIN